MSGERTQKFNIDSLPLTKEAGKIEMRSADFGGGFRAIRLTVRPGGSWSNDLKEAAGTSSCERRHFGVVLSGGMGVRMDDGHENTFGPHELYMVPPGHDAWCLGDEAAELLEFDFSEQSSGTRQGSGQA